MTTDEEKPAPRTSVTIWRTFCLINGFFALAYVAFRFGGTATPPYQPYALLRLLFIALLGVACLNWGLSAAENPETAPRWPEREDALRFMRWGGLMALVGLPISYLLMQDMRTPTFPIFVVSWLYFDILVCSFGGALAILLGYGFHFFGDPVASKDFIRFGALSVGASIIASYIISLALRLLRAV